MFSTMKPFSLKSVNGFVSTQIRFQSSKSHANDGLSNLLKGIPLKNDSTKNTVNEILNNKGFVSIKNNNNNSKGKHQFLSGNDLTSSTAKQVADSLPVTGPIAGRIVSVHKGDIGSAYQQLKRIVNSNNIRGEAMQQRFHMKPGKVLEMKRMKRKKREFDEGIRRLMGLVKEAKRRGY